jgi:small multidrug resistance pump
VAGLTVKPGPAARRTPGRILFHNDQNDGEKMNFPPYLILLGAILAEVTATNLLKASNGFARLVPGVLSVAAYGGVLYLFSIALTRIPIGPAYAIWSGVGIALSAIIGWVIWHESLSPVQITGMVLITVGAMMVVLTSSPAGIA